MDSRTVAISAAGDRSSKDRGRERDVDRQREFGCLRFQGKMDGQDSEWGEQ